MKTRDKLIEVARQLFARKGVEHTTMNDIAEASDKGRRTVYTYFANKREIYRAVIERESDQMVEQLRAIVDDASVSPADRLRRLIIAEGEAARAAARERGGLWSSLFTLNFTGRDDRIRRLARRKEKDLVGRIVKIGCDEGAFDPTRCINIADMLQLLSGGAYHAYRQEVADAAYDRAHPSAAETHQRITPPSPEAIADFIIRSISV